MMLWKIMYKYYTARLQFFFSFYYFFLLVLMPEASGTYAAGLAYVCVCVTQSCKRISSETVLGTNLLWWYTYSP